MLQVRTTVRALEPTSAETDLYLPKSVCRKLKIPLTALTIQFGSIQATGQVKEFERSSTTVIRPSLARTLRIPTGIPLQLRYEANLRRLVFGPLIGILISRFSQNARNPYGTFTPFLNEIADICRQRGGVAVAFRMQDVNWETETVRGLIRRNGLWHTATLPLPQCIYNRIGNRKSEKAEELETLITRCKERQIPFFNEHFLNKWHVHRALQAVPEATPYLPKTVRYHAHQDLVEMVGSFPSVYAKPTNGSMGKGIYQIRTSSAGYKLTRPTPEGTATQTFRDVMSLHRALQKQTKGKAYLLQQGLSLIGRNGKPTDFRVLVQKDRRGKWSVSSLVARLGQNKVVSNIARGGSMISPRQALLICGPRLGGSTSVEEIKQVAQRLATMLEDSIQGHYAEFGVDLGVDTRGRIWLLEVNSKPSKSTSSVQQPDVDGEEGEPQPSLRRKPRPSVVRMLDYAAYLSGFPLPSNEKKKVKVAKKRKRKRR
ncbi:YheC/YheD family endospore coat-associated protein [Brevibacillus migulae]|uniref:YheC/YheD family endospore coat-associated protein n=1 Tax=Brevibacillus migulae TaxID=1644114 RepID=UPI00106E9ECF|nr:YheC/YheD family protein [Brevibacillus migulae]